MNDTYIFNGQIIDGTGREPIANGALLVRGNRIIAVGQERDVPRPGQPHTSINAHGGTILPGLIDTHVHFMLEGLNLAQSMATPFSLVFYQAIDRMRRTLDAGITSVRDAGGTDLGMKMAVEQGLIPGPRMQISISVLTTTGGHADFWMRSGLQYDLVPPYPGHPGTSLVCDGVEEVRKKVRELLRAGAEVIKVCATGGVASPTDHPDFTQFTPEELAVMVQEGAYRGGIKVMAHAQGAEGIKNAIRAGIHSIEHGIFLDDEGIELMLAHGTYLVPTLVAPIGVLEAAEKGDVSEWAVRKARETVEIHSENIAKAYRAGVRVAMGTDAGVVPHGTNLRELGLMADIGMPPMDVIVSTTRLAAECLGWQDRLGTLAAGKLADIIITRTNPLTELKSLANPDNIVLVMKDGQVMKGQAMKGQA
ncbi:MAG: amidohydrolase family protein [Ardenticatenaceae bacterium]|nr:amidohydrolase family protein [Anaerolineales bacterium]MCB8919030.1 amidohydrolase family protein [Ardenticatenaceae bacterium]